MVITEPGYTLYCADCLDVLDGMEENSIDAVIVDPPSGIKFMGKRWDNKSKYAPRLEKARALQAFLLSIDIAPWAAGFAAFTVDWSTACYRVIKPGGIMACWALPRTSDLVGLAHRAAQWWVRDVVTFLFGCLSEDTEILTSEGWKGYETILENDSVLCYNVDDDRLGYMPVQEVFVYEYADTAYRIRSDRTDQIVSRNHRCLVERQGKMVFERAESIASEQEIRVPVLESVPSLSGSFPVPYKRTSQQKQDLFAKVCCGFDSSGKGKKATKAAHDFDMQAVRKRVQTKRGTHKVLQSKVLWTLAGVESSDPRTHAENCKQRGNWAHARRAGKIARKNDGRKQSGVEGRRNVFSEKGPIRAIQYKVRSVPERVHGNGTQGRLRDGASPDRRAAFGACVETFGGCASYRSQPREQRSGQSDVVCQQQPAQKVRGDWKPGTTMATITPMFYVGKVWCVRVPTGAFVARRNGQIFITGNSGFPKGGDMSRLIDEHLGNEREIVGRAKRTGKEKGILGKMEGDNAITVPATDEAELWDGYHTLLKPAVEYWLLCQKPTEGSFAENALKWGTGALNIDGLRIPTQEDLSRAIGYGGIGCQQLKNIPRGTVNESHPCGRFPAHLILDDEAARLLDAQTGVLKGSPDIWRRTGSNRFGGGAYNAGEQYRGEEVMIGYADEGGASRYFNRVWQDQNRFWYGAKASRSEREEGLDDMPEGIGGGMQGTADQSLKTGAGNVRSNRRRNIHSTVKPLGLMEYLVTLLRIPTGGVVLDPMMGSGSTGVACMEQEIRFIGMEKEREYFEIARRRIAHEEKKPIQNTFL